jgi:microcystin-dependent protein
MANYVKATNFTAKDGLPTGNSGKIVKGAEIDTELSAVANAIASKADINSPNLTGTPTAPTANLGSNTTQLATTAFVAAGLSALIPTGVITLWSGSIISIPSGWALCNGSNGTPNLRDRFVVGAGTTYAVGATGGANTVTLDATMIPSHTHSLSASGTTAESGAHTHTVSASGTTSGQSVGHTHSGTTASDGVHTHTGTTGTESANHTHTFSGTTSGQSADHTHNQFGLATNGQGGGGDVNQRLTGVTNTTATSGTSNDHTHTYSGTTSTVSANHTHSFTTASSTSHTHTFTTGGVSSDHTHTVTVTGTTGAVSTTHTHTVTVTGTSGGTGGGLAHENRPPYYALAYIMKT